MSGGSFEGPSIKRHSVLQQREHGAEGVNAHLLQLRHSEARKLDALDAQFLERCAGDRKSVV